jgi:hypothetical protein
MWEVIDRTKSELKDSKQFRFMGPRKKETTAYGVSRFQLLVHGSPQTADSTMSLVSLYGATHTGTALVLRLPSIVLEKHHNARSYLNHRLNEAAGAADATRAILLTSWAAEAS